jgi:hypothetical protein
VSADHVTLATGACAATLTASEARAEMLAFARQLYRALGLHTLDGTQHAEVAHDGLRWRATAHLTGCRVVGITGSLSGCEDGEAGVWGSGETPAAAVASAINAWRVAMRRRREEAERVEVRARESADNYRRICAEVGA